MIAVSVSGYGKGRPFHDSIGQRIHVRSDIKIIYKLFSPCNVAGDKKLQSIKLCESVLDIY